MSQIVSYTSFDYEPVTMLPVIASFSDDGHIRPLYVRIAGESYKVDSYWVRSQFTNQIDFNCKLIVHDCLKPLLITYHVRECLWTIPKLKENR
jgi:hypothetical protein